MAVDLTLARARFKQGEDAETKQREREKQDLAFYQGEGQWPEEIKTMRKGQTALAGMPAVPARPCLTINKIKGPVTHVENEFTESDLGISILPADDIEGQPIDEKEIELREGLTRRIQRQSHAQDAMIWAGKRAAICGRGFFGIMTRDVPGPTFDQEIYFERYLNQFRVVLDPAHEQPDASDIDWGFVGTDVPWDIYQVEHATLADGSDNPIIGLDEAEWRALGDDAPGWFTTTGETRSVRVSQYWRYERTRVEYCLMPDGSIVTADTLDKETSKALPPTHRKTCIEKQVKFALIDGKNTLAESDWDGRFIPLVKVIGEEIQPFDGERRTEGMVRPSRDSQQAYNYMISAAVEAIGLAPKAPVVGYKGQFEGFEEVWDMANTRTIGRLEFNATTDDTGSQILPPPQRQTAEPPIQAMSLMMQVFDETIMSTLNVPGVRQGNVDPKIRSGRAIQQMLQQSARGTSGFMNNFVRSVQRAGEIVNDLLYPVYSREGRKVRMMTSKHETKKLILHKPFVMQGDEPVPFDPQAHAGQTPQFFTLTKDGAFNVAIKVSKNYDTKSEQIAAQLGELISSDPQFMTWFGDLYLNSVSDLPEHKAMAERAKAMLAPPIQKFLAEGQPPNPQVAQLEGQVEQMQQALQKADADKGAKIEAAQIKAQSDAQRTASDNATKVAIAQYQGEVQLAIADLKTSTQQAIASATAAVEQMRTFVQQAHESRLEHAGHERAALEAVHGSAHESALSAQEHAQTLEQISHEAAVTPKPEDDGA